MNPHRGGRVSLLFAGVLGVAGALEWTSRALGDTVVVNGRTLKGTIVEETDDHVVLRVGAGTMTLQRTQITSIVREDEATTALQEARALVGNRDQSALAAFDRAIAALEKRGDAARAKAVGAERAAFAAKLEPRAAPPTPPSAGSPLAPPAGSVTVPQESTRPPLVEVVKGEARTVPGDPFLLRSDIAAVATLLATKVQADAEEAARILVARAQEHQGLSQQRWAVGCVVRARKLTPWRMWNTSMEQYLRQEVGARLVIDRDLELARLAIEPLGELEGRDESSEYLLGRVAELGSRPEEAVRRYRRVLEMKGVRLADLDSTPLDVLAHCARQTADGRPIGPDLLGCGPAWSHVKSESFTVFYKVKESSRAPTKTDLEEYERARALAAKALGISEADARRGNRILVFVFDDAPERKDTDDLERLFNHFRMDQSIDGYHPVIATRFRSSVVATIRHEAAHTFKPQLWKSDYLLDDRIAEGMAVLAEPEASQTLQRQRLKQAYERRTVIPLRDFLSATALLNEADKKTWYPIFYARSYCVLAALVEWTKSPKDAIALAWRLMTEEPEPVLASIGRDVAALEKKVRDDLAKASDGPR